MDLIQLTDKAIEAALAAGKIIQKHMEAEVLVEHKTEPSSYAAQVVTEVDRACERVIMDHLRSTCNIFDLAIVSEESADDGGRHVKEYFWCIDPMDGTLAFINKKPGFSVSIALVEKEGKPLLGVVYDPSRDVIYHAIKGLGAFKNKQPWKIVNENNYLTYVTDKELAETPHVEDIKKVLQAYLNKLDLETVKEMNGAGSVMNGIYVLENGPACMMKLPKQEKGGGSIWDFAAIACIYNELGLPATNYAGAKLDLNRVNSSFMNHEGVLFENLLF